MLAVISGFFATCLGAFGAHALKSNISLEMLAVYQAGVKQLRIITPLGGIAFLVGWLMLVLGVLKCENWCNSIKYVSEEM